MEPRQVFSAYDRQAEPPESPAFCSRCGSALAPAPATGVSSCSACGHVSYRNAAPAVSVLVVDGDRIVLCRRAPTAFRGGMWCLPCGFVDYDEDFLTAGRREVREETGLDVTVRSIVSVVSNFHTPELHTVVVVMVADIVGGELVAGDDVDAVVWHRAGDDLPPLAFEADEHIIERYRAAPFAGAAVESFSPS